MSSPITWCAFMDDFDANVIFVPPHTVRFKLYMIGFRRRCGTNSSVAEEEDWVSF